MTVTAIKGREHTCSAYAYACCHHPRERCRCHYRHSSMRSSMQWGWLSCVPDNQQDLPTLLFSQTTSPLGLVEPAFIPCHVTLHLHVKLSFGFTCIHKHVSNKSNAQIHAHAAGHAVQRAGAHVLVLYTRCLQRPRLQSAETTHSSCTQYRV